MIDGYNVTLQLFKFTKVAGEYDLKSIVNCYSFMIQRFKFSKMMSKFM